MSKILRHKGMRRGVPVGLDGFARFDDLLVALRGYGMYTCADVFAAAQHSYKRMEPRFEMLEDPVEGRLIRATRKHTLEHVDRQLVAFKGSRRIHAQGSENDCRRMCDRFESGIHGSTRRQSSLLSPLVPNIPPHSTTLCGHAMRAELLESMGATKTTKLCNQRDSVCPACQRSLSRLLLLHWAHGKRKLPPRNRG